MNNPTRVLRYAQLAASGVLAAVGINTDADWRLLAVTVLWGGLTGAWAFSAGWDDARGEQ